MNRIFSMCAALFLGAAFARADVVYVLELSPYTFVTGTGFSGIYVNLNAARKIYVPPSSDPVDSALGKLSPWEFVQKQRDPTADFQRYCDELIRKSK
jgi:hypothetical protein